MRIVSHKKLKDFYSRPGHEDARVPLERWYTVAEDAQWKGLTDIRKDFASADFVGNQHYVFNIGGNKYRLVVVVKFMMGYLFIRFVGTHNEYDKIDASTV
jgi:mRNA interferase HigB